MYLLIIATIWGYQKETINNVIQFNLTKREKNNFRYAYLLKQKGLFRALFIGKT